MATAAEIETFVRGYLREKETAPVGVNDLVEAVLAGIAFAAPPPVMVRLEGIPDKSYELIGPLNSSLSVVRGPYNGKSGQLSLVSKNQVLPLHPRVDFVA